MPALAISQLDAPLSRPSVGLTGRVLIGDAKGLTAIEVSDLRIARRGLTCNFPWALAEGSHAWVEVNLPNGTTLKPLVAVLKSSAGSLSARIVHLFPVQQKALESWVTSSSGY
jgi:hypothetical protein